jgi:hypothetical protein
MWGVSLIQRSPYVSEANLLSRMHATRLLKSLRPLKRMKMRMRKRRKRKKI